MIIFIIGLVCFSGLLQKRGLDTSKPLFNCPFLFLTIVGIWSMLSLVMFFQYVLWCRFNSWIDLLQKRFILKLLREPLNGKLHFGVLAPCEWTVVANDNPWYFNRLRPRRSNSSRMTKPVSFSYATSTSS